MLAREETLYAVSRPLSADQARRPSAPGGVLVPLHTEGTGGRRGRMSVGGGRRSTQGTCNGNNIIIDIGSSDVGLRCMSFSLGLDNKRMSALQSVVPFDLSRRPAQAPPEVGQRDVAEAEQ